MTALITSTTQSQVKQLIVEGKERVSDKDVAQVYVNKIIGTVPKLLDRSIKVSYKNAREQQVIKDQDLNLTLWTVALQTTLETGYTSYDLLAAIFQAWAADNTPKQWAKDSAKRIATAYIKGMKSMNLLAENLKDREYVDAEGKLAVGRVTVPTDEVLAELAAIREDREGTARMVCRPLHQQPRDWEVGVKFAVDDESFIPLVKSGRTQPQLVLDGVNKLQRVPYVMNKLVLAEVEMALDNMSSEEGKERFHVYMAILDNANNDMFFPITMDVRGRMYYRGGLLSPQGEDVVKASLQFKKARPLGKNGLKALYLHIANCKGIKGNIAERIRWTHRNTEELLAVTSVATVEAEEPWQYFAAAKDYQHYVQSGLVEKYSSRIICHQDGSCNGIQHMAAITKDYATAKSVNATAAKMSDPLLDMYTSVGKGAINVVSDDAMKRLLELIGRELAKNPVMTTGYGASEDTVVLNMAKKLTSMGQPTKYAEPIVKAMLQVMSKEAGAVSKLTNAVKRRVKQAIQAGVTEITWVTHDGFVASTNYTDNEDLRIRAGVWNSKLEGEGDFDEIKTTGAATPNFVHSIDGTHVREVSRECDWELAAIHDSIGSHAGTFWETKTQINNAFAVVHQYDALGNLCDSLGVTTPTFIGSYDVNEARSAAHLFS